MLEFRKIFILERGDDKYTEEYVYNNCGKYILYSGNTINNGIMGMINSYDNYMKEGILYTTVGVKAGTQFFINGMYSLSQNCRMIHLNPDFEGVVNLKYFFYNYKYIFKHAINGRFNNPSITDESFYRLKFKLIDYDIQLRISDIFEKASNFKMLIINKIDVLRSLIKDLSIKKINRIKTSELIFSSVLNIIGGNSGLTEEFIYNNLPDDNEESIPIMTSATLDRTSMGFISKNAKIDNKKLKLFKGPAIIIARNGYAGTMQYIDSGIFTTNDHAYVIVPKDEWKNKLNLEWFIYQYQQLFFNIVTS